MPEEKSKFVTLWGTQSVADEIKELEGDAALYVGFLKNMDDAQKAVYDKVKSDLEAEQAALKNREAKATSYIQGEEAKIAQGRAELEAKYPVLEKREKELAGREATYQTDKTMLDQTVGEVGNKKKELEAREAQLKAREDAFKDRDAGLAANEKAYAERDAKLSEKATAIDGMDEMLKKKEADLKKREEDIATKENELNTAYKKMEEGVAQLSAGMAKDRPSVADQHRALGGDRKTPPAAILTDRVKKLKKGEEKEDVLYKHEFPVGQQDEVVKVLDGFGGMESSQMTGPDTKYTLTGRKADEKRNECDYSWNKGEVKVQFTTKNPAVDTMLAGMKLGQKFAPIRVRPKDRDSKIKEFPDFADLTPKKTGTDEKGEYFIYDLNDEQKKRYKIKALPPKKAKADGQ